jgi:hypothetical protein
VVVDVEVVTSDGINDHVQIIPGFVITTECGPESTTITAPSLNALTKEPNTLPVLSIEGQFASSNIDCPVTSHELVEGEDSFDLVDNGAGGFLLSMEEDDNEVKGVYSYTIRAFAEGGRFIDVKGTKSIATGCVTYLVETFEKEFIFHRPADGQSVENFPSASTDYVTKPAQIS